MTKFVRDMQDRKISYYVVSLQSEIFLQALEVVVEILGDWHTCLNMLTSIYSLYYAGFPDQFQALLGWKKVNKDVCPCYFQASCLVTFISDELMRFLFVNLFPTTQEMLILLWQMLRMYAEHASSSWRFFDQKSSDDKWIAMCTNFLEVSFDFIKFVSAY